MDGTEKVPTILEKTSVKPVPKWKLEYRNRRQRPRRPTKTVKNKKDQVVILTHYVPFRRRNNTLLFI